MNDTTASRPVPKKGTFVDTAPFWEGMERGELVLQYCKDTGRFQHYPRPVSIYTGSRNVGWKAVSGKGVIYTRTVVRIPGPGITSRLPLAVAIIDLDEGARVLGNILGADPDDVHIGARVELAWDELDGGQRYPAFRLTGD